MNERDIELANQVDLIQWDALPSGAKTPDHASVVKAQKFADLIRADEREQIIDEWWSVVQADLENGVKCLNEQAAIKWRQEYPSMATFGEWLEKRGNT